jgi:hypothetical protein
MTQTFELVRQIENMTRDTAEVGQVIRAGEQYSQFGAVRFPAERGTEDRSDAAPLHFDGASRFVQGQSAREAVINWARGKLNHVSHG